MSGRLDWAKANIRDRMVRQGTESAVPRFPGTSRRKRKGAKRNSSKEQRRLEALAQARRVISRLSAIPDLNRSEKQRRALMAAQAGAAALERKLGQAPPNDAPPPSNAPPPNNAPPRVAKGAREPSFHVGKSHEVTRRTYRQYLRACEDWGSQPQPPPDWLAAEIALVGGPHHWAIVTDPQARQRKSGSRRRPY
jgi:hypothetical protein